MSGSFSTNKITDPIKEIHILPYSHHDHAWAHLRQWHIRRYIGIFQEALDLMNEHDGFTWMIDNVLESLAPFIRYCPERVEELKRRVREGRIYVANGGLSLARSATVGEETFLRNMIEGSRFFRTFFDLADVELFFNADVGCGHSQLPQILKLGGHRYYRFERPEDALDYKKVPKQFIWKGLDGTCIHVSRGVYHGFIGSMSGAVNSDSEAEWEKAKQAFCDTELAGKTDRPSSVDIVWLNCGNDDTRPLLNTRDEPVPVLAFIEEWNRREASSMFFSTPGAYFAALAKRELPVHEGVLDPCELAYNAPVRGEHSMWRIRLELDRLLVKAETLAAMAALMGAPYPEESLKTCWSRLFEITGHAIEFTFREDFERLYFGAAEAKFALQRMIRDICDEMAQKLVGSGGSSYVLFNPLGWDRKEFVELQVAAAHGLSGFELYDPLGRRVEYQVIDSCPSKKFADFDYSSVNVIAETTVPSMGYACVTARSGGQRLAVDAGVSHPADESNRDEEVTIDNGVMEIAFIQGRIKSITEIASGKRIVSKPGNEIGILKFTETIPTATWLTNWDSVQDFWFAPQSWRLEEKGPLRWKYRTDGTIGKSKVSLAIVIRKAERAVGFELTLDSFEEEGYFAVQFPTDADTTLLADIPFGVEERELSKELYGIYHGSHYNFNTLERSWPGQFYAKNWTLFTCGRPAAVVSENGSIYYNHDRKRNVLSLLLHRTMRMADRNAHWLRNTHSSIDGKGVHHYSYHLYFPPRMDSYADMVRFAQTKRQPVEAASQYKEMSVPAWPLQTSFFRIDRANAAVSAFYGEGETYVLRLYETEGKQTPVHITADLAITDAVSVDLLGRELQHEVNINTAARTLAFPVRPWQIVTLHLKVR